MADAPRYDEAIPTDESVIPAQRSSPTLPDRVARIGKQSKGRREEGVPADESGAVAGDQATTSAIVAGEVVTDRDATGADPDTTAIEKEAVEKEAVAADSVPDGTDEGGVGDETTPGSATTDADSDRPAAADETGSTGALAADRAGAVTADHARADVADHAKADVADHVGVGAADHTGVDVADRAEAGVADDADVGAVAAEHSMAGAVVLDSATSGSGVADETDDVAGDDGDDEDVRERWWAPAVRVLRFSLGAVTLVGGLTWILVNLTGPSPLLDLLVGLVLSAGALVLLMPHRIRLPRRATVLAVVGAGLAGTVGGLFAATEQTCCAFAYLTDRGWPFRWVGRGAVAGDPDTAFRLAQDADWQINLVSLSANVLLWAYTGLLLVVVAVLVRRNQSEHE